MVRGQQDLATAALAELPGRPQQGPGVRGLAAAAGAAVGPHLHCGLLPCAHDAPGRLARCLHQHAAVARRAHCAQARLFDASDHDRDPFRNTLVQMHDR